MGNYNDFLESLPTIMFYVGVIGGPIFICCVFSICSIVTTIILIRFCIRYKKLTALRKQKLEEFKKKKEENEAVEKKRRENDKKRKEDKIKNIQKVVEIKTEENLNSALKRTQNRMGLDKLDFNNSQTSSSFTEENSNILIKKKKKLPEIENLQNEEIEMTRPDTPLSNLSTTSSNDSGPANFPTNEKKKKRKKRKKVNSIVPVGETNILVFNQNKIEESNMNDEEIRKLEEQKLKILLQKSENKTEIFFNSEIKINQNQSHNTNLENNKLEKVDDIPFSPAKKILPKIK